MRSHRATPTCRHTRCGSVASILAGPDSQRANNCAMETVAAQPHSLPLSHRLPLHSRVVDGCEVRSSFESIVGWLNSMSPPSGYAVALPGECWYIRQLSVKVPRESLSNLESHEEWDRTFLASYQSVRHARILASSGNRRR